MDRYIHTTDPYKADCITSYTEQVFEEFSDEQLDSMNIDGVSCSRVCVDRLYTTTVVILAVCLQPSTDFPKIDNDARILQ